MQRGGESGDARAEALAASMASWKAAASVTRSGMVLLASWCGYNAPLWAVSSSRQCSLKRAAE